MTDYCTNSQCKKRDTCVFADTEIKGCEIRKQFYAVERYCEQYQCKHPVWRKFVSEQKKQCHNCLVFAPLFDAPEIQHQR